MHARQTAAELMQPVSLALAPDTEVSEALVLMNRHCEYLLPVCASNGLLIGIATRRDLLSFIHTDTPVGVLCQAVDGVAPDASVCVVAASMRRQGVTHMPVTDESGHLLGVIASVLLVLTAREGGD